MEILFLNFTEKKEEKTLFKRFYHFLIFSSYENKEDKVQDLQQEVQALHIAIESL